MEKGDNYTDIEGWGSNCSKPNQFCINKTTDNAYCPSYVGKTYENDCEGNTTANSDGSKSFECGTRKLEINCSDYTINTPYTES